MNKASLLHGIIDGLKEKQSSFGRSLASGLGSVALGPLGGVVGNKTLGQGLHDMKGFAMPSREFGAEKANDYINSMPKDTGMVDKFKSFNQGVQPRPVTHVPQSTLGNFGSNIGRFVGESLPGGRASGVAGSQIGSMAGRALSHPVDAMHNVGDRIHNWGQQRLLNNPESLKGINDVVGKNTYGVGSIDNQGQSHINPMGLDFKQLWSEHPGWVLGGGAALAGIPLLLHSLFSGGQQQQQAPPIVINNGVPQGQQNDRNMFFNKG